MPATEDVWRNLRKMHVVSAASAFALLAATLWMMQADYADEWRGIQSIATEQEVEQIDADLKDLTTAEFEAREKDLVTKSDAAKEEVKSQREKVKEAQKKVDHLDGQMQNLTRSVKFQRAQRDADRATLDLQVRDGLLGKALRPAQEQFEKSQGLVDRLELELQELQAQFDAAKAELAKLTKPLDDAQAALKKHETDLARLNKAKEKLAPKEKLVAFKRWLMEQWIIEGFNGPLKINQIWLPDLTINFGGMRDVARYDRCITCHTHIERVGTGNVAAFPYDPKGISIANAKEFLHGETTEGKAWRDSADKGYAHPFATHPNPDLYLTSASPHPMQKFGCTSCHEGQGSGTSFHNASHSPNSPDIADGWHKKYGYSYNHFWEFPMYPKRLREAACLKCHQNVVELGVHPKFGNSAPTLFKGYELIRQYGCFGCHEINGYNNGKPIGPDMRLEPQTAEEAERIAADPTAIAGTMRKVGPGLRHLATKTNKAWTEYWVEEPKRFHPETRMPQFFNLTNQKDAHAKELQPVEIAGIVNYLFAKSEELKTDKWAEGYEPSAENGKKLFSQRGCLACHAHNEFEGIKADFGPDLTHVHQKLTSKEWLYTWLRDPKKHSDRTRMPNLYLEPETVNNVTTDPAADIAAFLTAKGPAEYKPIVLPGTYFGAAFDSKFDDEAARKLGLEKAHGALITWVMPGSAATRTYALGAGAAAPKAAGASSPSDASKLSPLQVNDVVVRYDGNNIKDAAQLTALVSATRPGREVHVTVNRGGKDIELRFDPDTPLHDLTRLYLRKSLDEGRTKDVMTRRVFPESEAAKIRGSAIKPDEIELVEGKIDDETMLRYIGRRSISRYGCYGCHDIPGFEKARPIGTALQDWGRKDPTKLALEHIEEYLHHHGEPDGSSTAQRVEKAIVNGINDNYTPEEADERDRESAAAYFFDQLNHHGRAGFLWQKLRDPRSYDFKKVETKGYDERLRMPKFPFTEKDIEAIATFVVGLVAEPPAEKYVYRPQGAAKARIDGEKLLAKYNCTGCHMLELPKITGIPEDTTPYDPEESDFPEAFELLLKLKPPRNALLKKGEPALSFHGLLFQPADPEDDPADQTVFYDLWETISLGENDKLLVPGRRMELRVNKLIEAAPGRGGAFSEWLVNASTNREVDRKSAWHMVPPPLYLEGIKVQTPWLYSFLKDPGRIRYTTVLRMPQFTLSNDEAEKLANYFAAVDGAPFPYQDVPQREPDYLSVMEEHHADYLRDAWKVITRGPPAGVCAGCHAVGGREFVAGDPTKVTRGPNLDGVTSRLRPDWAQLWIYNPVWFTPYTKMPQNFTKAGTVEKKLFPDLFDGDQQQQAVAARDALMNYLRMLEKEGKATAVAPAAPAAPGGAEDDKK